MLFAERRFIRMKKKWIVGLAMLLLLSVCMTSLMSCGEKEPDPAPVDSSDSTKAPQDEVDFSKTFDVPENMNPEPKTFKILRYDAYVPEFGFSGEGADSIELALYSRDLAVQEYLNVDFDLGDPVAGQFNDRNSFVQHVENSVFANIQWDMIAAYAFVPPALSIRGLLVDLKTEGSYVNTEKAWWPDFMVDSCEINGKAYYLSGDISSNLLYWMQAVLFNKRVVESQGIDLQEDIYNKVYEGEWTLDYFFEICENMSQDKTGDGWDENDFYAISMESANMLDSFYVALGLHLFDKDENGLLQVSPDVNGEKVLNVYDMCYTAIQNNTLKIPKNGSPLSDGRCAFGIYTIYQMRTTLKENVLDYRVLPFPKYTERDEYRTLVSNPHTEFCIPANTPSVKLSTAAMESMAYYSYSIVTPEIYEVTMKLKYSAELDNAKMFEMLRAGATYDPGIFYYMSFSSGIEPASMFRNALQLGVDNWTSYYEGKFKEAMTGVVNDLNTFYKGNT